MKEKRIVVDEAHHLIRVDGREIRHPEKEYRVLLAFAQARGIVLTREALIARVWPDKAGLDIDTRTVDQHIARIRTRWGAKYSGLIMTPTLAGYRILDENIGFVDEKPEPIVRKVPKVGDVLHIKLSDFVKIKPGQAVLVQF